MTTLRKVSICILSWNGRKHLESCLPALRTQEPPGIDWEVLVLDNGSKDGTAEWLRREHSWIRLFESPVNSGFCAGNNFLVTKAEGEAVVFLNNDTRPAKGWLAALVAALREAPEDVAAVSGRIVDWDGERLDFARGIMTFDGHAFQLDFGRLMKSARLVPDGGELLFPCGGNMIVKKRSFQRIGGFDEAYFAYLEDVDLGWRLWAGGERVLSAARAVVHHRSAATSDLLGLYNRGFLFERNAFLTAYKNYEEGLWQRMMPAVLLTLVSRTQTLLVENNAATGTLTVDPYAGAIADTAGREDPRFRPPPGPRRGSFAWLAERQRTLGTAELFRRGLSRTGAALRSAFSKEEPPEHPVLSDPRTVAQLRAHQWILDHLDEAAAKRATVQKRRKRPDEEIFRRFPLYLVPTYPGDEALFASEGFRAWLPEEPRIEHHELSDVMALGDGTGET